MFTKQLRHDTLQTNLDVYGPLGNIWEHGAVFRVWVAGDVAHEVRSKLVRRREEG